MHTTDGWKVFKMWKLGWLLFLLETDLILNFLPDKKLSISSTASTLSHIIHLINSVPIHLFIHYLVSCWVPGAPVHITLASFNISRNKIKSKPNYKVAQLTRASSMRQKSKNVMTIGFNYSQLSACIWKKSKESHIGWLHTVCCVCNFFLRK